MMGKETAASKKTHSNRLPLKDNTKVFSPQQGISLPAEPNKVGPEGAAKERWGKMEKLARVSTKKSRFVSWSSMWTRGPGATALRRLRPASFPSCRVPHTFVPCPQSSSERNRDQRRAWPRQMAQGQQQRCRKQWRPQMKRGTPPAVAASSHSRAGFHHGHCRHVPWQNSDC
jgi:hypothetical protein